MITTENWPNDFSTLPVGTEISEEVYYHFLDILPPFSLKKSLFAGFQVSEPHSYQKTERGIYAPTYMTFVSRNGKYFYAGTNFHGICAWDGSAA